MKSNISVVEEYEELPSEIRKKILTANVFFSKNYSNYAKILNEQIVYLYSDDYIISVKVRKAIIFKFAVFLSEYFNITENPKTDPKDFLNNCIRMLISLYKVQWCISTASGFFNCYPNNSIFIPFGSHVINLTQSHDNIFSNMNSKHRNSIRRAERSGVVVKNGGEELLEDYLKLDNDTWERSGSNSHGINYYKNMITGLGDNVRVFIAYMEDKPQAGGIFYYNKAMCYYMYGATKNNPEAGSANLLHWEAIKFMKDVNVKEYSFVGCRINEDMNSKYHGIQRFKERFGGELIQGYLFRYENSPYMYKLFCLAMQLRSKDKSQEYKDAIDQEIHKWKDIQDKQKEIPHA